MTAENKCGVRQCEHFEFCKGSYGRCLIPDVRQLVEAMAGALEKMKERCEEMRLASMDGDSMDPEELLKDMMNYWLKSINEANEALKLYRGDV